MATVWSTRSTGYKVGLGGMFFSAFLYLLGFSLPYWWDTEALYQGLWLICGKTHSGTKICATLVRSFTATWYQAMQGMEAVGLIFLIIGGLYALYINCRSAPYSHNRLVEVLSALAGLLGLISCMIFVGKTLELSSKAAEHYSGGFATNLVGSVLLLLFTAVIAKHNDPATAQQQPPAAVVFHPGVVTTTQAMPPGAVAYAPPPQGGQYPPAGYGYPAPAQAGYPAAYPAAYPSAYPAPVQDSK